MLQTAWRIQRAMDMEIVVLQEHVTVTLRTVATLHVGHAALTTTIIQIAYVPLPSPPPPTFPSYFRFDCFNFYY
jgi:hypothetical protein